MFSQRFLCSSSLFFFHSFFFLWQWFQPVSLLSYLFICLIYSAIDSFYYSFNFSYYSSLFFKAFRFLLNISCILLVWSSIIFPRWWIIFTMIIVNYFSGRLTWSTSLSYCSWVLFPSSGTCFFSISFCLTLFVVSIFRLPDHNTSCFWCLPPVGKVGQGACADFLVGGTFLTTGEWTWSCPFGGQDCVKGCVYRQLLAEKGFRQPVW